MEFPQLQGHMEMVIRAPNEFYANALENVYKYTKGIWTIVTPGAILASSINGNLY